MRNIMVVCWLCISPTFAHAFETAATLTGVATVVDGDGIEFGDVEVRLQGIAAPELPTPLGQASADNLRALAAGELVVCELDGTTAGRGRRPVGVCRVDGQDLGRLQVLQGHARDCPAYSEGRYAPHENVARANGKDLSTSYDLPDYCR